MTSASRSGPAYSASVPPDASRGDGEREKLDARAPTSRFREHDPIETSATVSRIRPSALTAKPLCDATSLLPEIYARARHLLPDRMTGSVQLFRGQGRGTGNALASP